MIYTITLNPALDRTIWINATTPDDCNRIENEQMYAGGKGIDVSKVLTSFGVKNKALGLSAVLQVKSWRGCSLTKVLSVIL